MTATNKVFFTDEKHFYLNPPVNTRTTEFGLLGRSVR